MNYLVIGLLVSIGFGIGKIFTDILSEIIFMRLHENQTYKVICKNTDDKNKSSKKQKMAIGFCTNRMK